MLGVLTNRLRWRYSAPSWALFVPDGTWNSGAFGGGTGYEAIREYMATGAAIMPFAFHHISNPLIEVRAFSSYSQRFASSPEPKKGPS